MALYYTWIVKNEFALYMDSKKMNLHHTWIVKNEFTLSVPIVEYTGCQIYYSQIADSTIHAAFVKFN